MSEPLIKITMEQGYIVYSKVFDPRLIDTMREDFVRTELLKQLNVVRKAHAEYVHVP